MRLIQGFGINDLQDNRKESKEFSIWHGVIARCCSKKTKASDPAYKECFASEKFKRYSDFKLWCQNQIGFGFDDWQLDKDLIQKGNKEYHPDKCVFVPREINAFLRTRKKCRGLYPIGVTRVKNGNYITQLKVNNKSVFIGKFPTPELAFQAYKVAKEQAIKDMANKWKDQIDPRAYTALMNYQVEITD